MVRLTVSFGIAVDAISLGCGAGHAGSRTSSATNVDHTAGSDSTTSRVRTTAPISSASGGLRAIALLGTACPDVVGQVLLGIRGFPIIHPRSRRILLNVREDEAKRMRAMRNQWLVCYRRIRSASIDQIMLNVLVLIDVVANKVGINWGAASSATSQCSFPPLSQCQPAPGPRRVCNTAWAQPPANFTSFSTTVFATWPPRTTEAAAAAACQRLLDP